MLLGDTYIVRHKKKFERPSFNSKCYDDLITIIIDPVIQFACRDFTLTTWRIFENKNNVSALFFQTQTVEGSSVLLRQEPGWYN